MESKPPVTIEDIENMLKFNNIDHGTTIVWEDGVYCTAIRLGNNNFVFAELSSRKNPNAVDFSFILRITCPNDIIKSELVKLGYLAHYIYEYMWIDFGENFNKLIKYNKMKLIYVYNMKLT